MFANFHGDHGPKIQKREVIDAKITEAWCVVDHDVIVFILFAKPALMYSNQVKVPRQPFSLRLSSNLLIGISRVYNKQQLYLWGMSTVCCSSRRTLQGTRTNQLLFLRR